MNEIELANNGRLINLDLKEDSLVSEFSEREVREMFKALPYNLPKQVFYHFKKASLKEIKLVALSYSGNSKNPTFQEWIESYQHNKLLEKILIFQERGVLIKKELDKEEQELDKKKELNTSFEELKPQITEVKRLNSLYKHNEEYLLMLHEKLNKFITEQLKREAPSKIQLSTVKVTPGDVANLLNTAKKEIIEAEFEETK